MREHSHFSQGRKRWACAALFVAGLCLTGPSVAAWAQGQDDKDYEGGRLKAIVRAEQPSAPCTPNQTAAQDVATVSRRGDIVNLPEPLQTRLLQLAARPHTYLPVHAFCGSGQLKRKSQAQPAVSILSTRYHWLPTQHLYGQNPRPQRQRDANCR